MDADDICNIYNLNVPSGDVVENKLEEFEALFPDDTSSTKSDDRKSQDDIITPEFLQTQSRRSSPEPRRDSPPPMPIVVRATTPSIISESSSSSSRASSVKSSVHKPPKVTEDHTVLLNDIIREMHKDVNHSDFGEKITIIYDIDREVVRLGKLNIQCPDLEKPTEHMSIIMLQQLLLRYRSIRLNAGVEEFSTDTHIAGATALERFFDGKRQIFGMRPCLKGFSGRIGGLMTNTNIDSSAIFKRVLRAIGMFNDEGLTALGIVNAVCLTLASNSINTEADIKSISR